MRPAPQLSESEIRLEVEKLFRKEHRSKLVALYGRGEPGHFDWDGQKWEIVPTTCELDLRARLPVELDREKPRQVFLVDWVEDVLPLDIGCRLAKGRLIHIEADARLAALFGARQAEPAFAASALARLFLSGEVPKPRNVSGLRVGLDEAFRRFLEGRFDLGDDALADGASLFRWARGCDAKKSDAGAAFLRASEENATFRAVRRELLEWLGAKLGAVGVLAWRAFELQQTERVLQVGVLLKASSGLTDGYAQGLFGGKLGAWLPALATELRSAEKSFGELLGTLLQVDAQGDFRLLEGAEELAADQAFEPLRVASEWLPSGHRAREQAFATALNAFLGNPSVEGFERVKAALERVEAHRLDSRLRGAEHVERRVMVTRLAAWLCARRLRGGVAPHGAVWQPAVDLANQYAHEGGLVDWARQASRALLGDEVVGAAVRALLAAVDTEFRADDRRFAEAYVAWLQSGKPSSEVLPIEHVARKVIVPFAKEGARKLLVVLMDGMSHAAAAQVLSWMREQRRWNRIAWRMPGQKGPLALPPVLAVAPTLTDVSRAAFFAGEADPRFGDQDTGQDVKRWSQNRAAQELCGDAVPELFCRKELGVGDELPGDLKTRIASDQKLVAVVVNAIDEELKGSSQVMKDYSRNAIRPLDLLLSAAEGSDRAVLLAADHGHVLPDGNTKITGRLREGRGGGARWRALAEGEAPESDEVALPPSCWKPKGAARVAVLWDPGVSHCAPHHGEHGGLSLAEAVAPAILVAKEWADREHNDEALGSARLVEPDWWQQKPPRLVPAPADVVPVAPASEQLALLTVATPKVLASPAEEPALVSALRSSPVFKAQVAGTLAADVERVLMALSALARSGDVLPSSEFARECGVKPHQVSGVVARMGILNADGFAIVEHDVVGKRVVLHRARLLQQYGVKG